MKALDVNLVAVLVSGVAAFVISGGWYAVLGKQLAELSTAYAEPGRAAALTAIVELARNLLVAGVIAVIVSRANVAGIGPGVVLGIVLWIGFPVVLLAGSVFHERVPLALAAIHSGDWLLKLVVVSAILARWR